VHDDACHAGGPRRVGVVLGVLEDAGDGLLVRIDNRIVAESSANMTVLIVPFLTFPAPSGAVFQFGEGLLQVLRSKA